MYIIKDWAGNIMFEGQEFKTFEDGWEFIYESGLNEEEYQDIFVEEV